MSTGHSYQDVAISGNARVHLGNINYYGADVDHSEQDCLRSLAFPEMNDRPNDIDGAANGTCEWLLRHQAYRGWVSYHRGSLWIKGKPGSGKSTLLKYALQQVQAGDRGGDRGRDKALILSFFFHGRGSELQKKPLGLFRSLLHQLLNRVPDALSDLIDTFRQRCDSIGTPGEKWHWHLRELQDFFELSLPKVLETYSVRVYIDALDESGKDNAVNLVKKFKSILQRLPSTGLHFGICFTCRHYPILDCEHGLQICLERENQKDISIYVRTQLSTKHVQAVDMITNRAQGVFLWVYLIVERVLELEHEGEEPAKILAEVQHIPQSLDELYRELIRNMTATSASLKLIQWICLATRPLSMDELRWAMVVDADCPHKTLQQCQKAEDYINDDGNMERRVKTLSCGLAEIVQSSNARVVQFIHQSVKDFFVKGGLSALDVASQPESLAIGSAHYRLSRSCIRYLAMEEIAQSTGFNRWNLRSNFPLLHYATTSWVTHAKQSDVEEVSQVDLLDYFAWPSEFLVQAWVRIYHDIDEHSVACPPKGTSLLHVVSRYELIQPLWVVLQKADQSGTDIDCRDGYGRTPLSYAAEKGNEDIVKLLLNTERIDADSKGRWSRTPLLWVANKGRGAIIKLGLSTRKVDIDSKDKYGRTPLLWAAEKGHEAMVKLLLATGMVNIDSKDTYGRTPLLWAAEKGHEAIIELLLTTGKVDVNLKNIMDRTPLSWAAGNGHQAIVKLLLATGRVDVDSKDKYGRTPLSWAAEKGNEAIIELLLATGKVDINSKDDEGRMPLSWAAEKGNEAIIELLLATGKVDVDLKDARGITPLSWAAGNGHKSIVKLLLATGEVNIDSEDKYGRTPLSWAVIKGNEAIIKLLLATGKVDINSKDTYGRTPLLWAAEKGHEATIELLLATGKVDFNLKNIMDRTPLSWAAGNGHQAIVKLLLATGRVDVDSKDKYGRTPLLWAVVKGHEAIIKLLLATGKVDTNSKDGEGRTPLSWAVVKGHKAIVKLLLATGSVDVDSKDKYGRTPLSWAAEKGHEAIVKLLLATGEVGINSKDDEGRTPLSWAVVKGHEAIVKLLLATGKVDVDSKDKYGRTPLLWAAEKGNEAIIELLLATGKVGINSKDDEGRTPLSWAVVKGHEAIVKLLLATGKVDVDSKDKYGRTPLLWAVEKEHEAIVKLLLATGKVDVDSRAAAAVVLANKYLSVFLPDD